MSYTIKPKLININDWSDQDVNPWTQSLNFKWAIRPWAEDPKYLLIVKDNEFIIIDKYGNKVLEKSVDYTIENAHINNNGDVITKSGANVKIYDITGEEIYSITMTDNVKGVCIGKNYAWWTVADVTVRCLDLSTFIYQTFSVPVNANWGGVHCSENGDICTVHGRISSSPYTGKVAFYDPSGKIAEINIVDSADNYVGVLKPDGTVAVSRYIKFYNGARGIALVRNDGSKATLSFVSSGSGSPRVVASLNLDRIVVWESSYSKFWKILADIDAMKLTLQEEVVTDAPPEKYVVTDMSPDGKYFAYPLSDKLLIYDFDTNLVKKEIPKLSGPTVYRMLFVEV